MNIAALYSTCACISFKANIFCKYLSLSSACHTSSVCISWGFFHHIKNRKRNREFSCPMIGDLKIVYIEQRSEILMITWDQTLFPPRLIFSANKDI